jgi:hypothetical protein
MHQSQASWRRAKQACLPAGVDRRACRRYSAPPLFCELLTGSRASVLDLSVRGLLLILEHQVQPEDVLPLRLSNRRQLSCCEVLLRIAWCRDPKTGLQMAGGAFIEIISQATLSALLG